MKKLAFHSLTLAPRQPLTEKQEHCRYILERDRKLKGFSANQSIINILPWAKIIAQRLAKHGIRINSAALTFISRLPESRDRKNALLLYATLFLAAKQNKSDTIWLNNLFEWPELFKDGLPTPESYAEAWTAQAEAMQLQIDGDHIFHQTTDKGNPTKCLLSNHRNLEILISHETTESQ